VGEQQVLKKPPARLPLPVLITTGSDKPDSAAKGAQASVSKVKGTSAARGSTIL
jgi:hypothetical protein